MLYKCKQTQLLVLRSESVVYITLPFTVEYIVLVIQPLDNLSIV